MSSKVPQLTALELKKVVEKLGYEFKRQKRSHMFFLNKETKMTLTIPNHPGRKLDRGLLNKIIKHDLKIDREEFMELLK